MKSRDYIYGGHVSTDGRGRHVSGLGARG